MKTDKRDQELLDDIASYFDMLASACEYTAKQNINKHHNLERANVWREAAADVRSIELI
jgi:hypothetical protein